MTIADWELLDEVARDDLEPAYLERRLEDWRRRLEGLFAAVADWADRTPGFRAEAGAPVVQDEPLMRRYALAPRTLPTLQVTGPGGARATLTPTALWVIGANGLVEIDAPNDIAKLYDFTRKPFTTPDWRLYSLKLGDRVPFSPALIPCWFQE